MGTLLWLRVDASREISAAQPNTRLQPSALGVIVKCRG